MADGLIPSSCNVPSRIGTGDERIIQELVLNSKGQREGTCEKARECGDVGS